MSELDRRLRAPLASAKLPGIVLCLVLTGLGTPPPASAQSPGDLVGTWVRPEYSAALPESCESATMELRADGSLEVRSGAQLLTGSYSVESRGDGEWLLVESDLETNGEPNCQDMDAETVLANYVHRAYVVVDGDTLTFHVGETAEAPSFTMERLGG